MNEREVKMETLVWIFNNVMPWLGVYFTITAIVFLVVFVAEIRKRYTINSHDDITEDAVIASIIANIIPLIFIKLISWLGEKIIIKWIEMKRKRTGMECKNKNCVGGRLNTRIKLTLNYGSGAGNFLACFCRKCRRLHYPAGDLVYSPFVNKGMDLFLHLDGITVEYRKDEEQLFYLI